MNLDELAGEERTAEKTTTLEKQSPPVPKILNPTSSAIDLKRKSGNSDSNSKARRDPEAANETHSLLAKAGSKTELATDPPAPPGVGDKREVPDFELGQPNLQKRVKCSESASSGESPAYTHRAQKNKLTNYFKSAHPGDKLMARIENTKAEDFMSPDFKQLVEPTPKKQPSQYELLLNEKDKEIGSLREKIQDLVHFKQKAKTMIAEQTLALENRRRLEEKSWISQEKQALGEYITIREGSKFKDVWIDGQEMTRLKESLLKIQNEKEAAEKKRRQIKRKPKPGESCEKKVEVQVPSSGFKYGMLHALTIDFNDSNSFNMLNDRSLEEYREHLNSQIVYLAKEENGIKEKIEFLEKRKEAYLALHKHVIEEENCRFGKLTVVDKEQKWPFMSNRYQLLSLLGKGGFSEVYRGYDVEELRFVACKIHQLSPNWTESIKSNYIKHILRETHVHKSISHPNIVAHYDTVEIDSNSFCTVLEYCNGPDLAAYLKKHKILTEKDAKSIIRQIFSALKFLNENDRKIIHYDLKPQNILFHNGIVKISDFGLCKIMNSDETKVELTSQGVGTYWYLPPECFMPEGAKISTKVDVWSAGVILYEMLFGVRPFGHEACQERIWKEGIMLKASMLEFPSKPIISTETKDFLKKCLVYSQEERMDVIEANNLLNKL